MNPRCCKSLLILKERDFSQLGQKQMNEHNHQDSKKKQTQNLAQGFSPELKVCLALKMFTYTGADIITRKFQEIG